MMWLKTVPDICTTACNDFQQPKQQMSLSQRFSWIGGYGNCLKGKRTWHLSNKQKSLQRKRLGKVQQCASCNRIQYTKNMQTRVRLREVSRKENHCAKLLACERLATFSLEIREGINNAVISRLKISNLVIKSGVKGPRLKSLPKI